MFFINCITCAFAIAPCPRVPLQVIAKIMEVTGIPNKAFAFAIMLVGIAAFTVSSLAGAIFLCGGFV